MYAKVNGYRLFFDVEGLQYVAEGAVMRERPVCLVMHGGPGADHTHYLPDLSPLAQYCQLIYIDDRNCGLSDHIDYTTNTVKQNVEDIEALREYLGLDKVFILGHSYGGMKAQYYAAHHPEHLYGAIIVATVPNAETFSIERIERNILRFGSQELADLHHAYTNGESELTLSELMLKILPLYHGKGKFKEEYIENEKHVTFNTELNRYQDDHELRVPEKYNLIPDLKKVDLPCLVIAGDQDFICDLEANQEIAAAIPGCEFHVLKGTSHEVFMDDPEIVFPLITDFMERNYNVGDR